MGEKLAKIYEFCRKEGGSEAAMRLAMKTRTPSVAAQSKPDSPDLVQQFIQAAKEITGKVPTV